MNLYIVRDWNLNIIGSIKATCAFDAQADWERQAGTGAMVLATRVRA